MRTHYRLLFFSSFNSLSSRAGRNFKQYSVPVYSSTCGETFFTARNGAAIAAHVMSCRHFLPRVIFRSCNKSSESANKLVLAFVSLWQPMIDSASCTSAQGGLIGCDLFSQNRQRRRLDSSPRFPLRETDILGYKVTNEAQIGADSRDRVTRGSQKSRLAAA